MSQSQRRLIDRDLPMFQQACNDVEFETAECMLLALEMASHRASVGSDLDRRAAPAANDKRPQLRLVVNK
jgi:hypothetical protein